MTDPGLPPPVAPGPPEAPAGWDRRRRRPAGNHRLALALGGVAVVVVAVVAALSGGGRSHVAPLELGSPAGAASVNPLVYRPADEPALVASAATGLSHVIYAKSPGGAIATVARTEALRPVIAAAAAHGPVDADTLEAIILLESAGRPDVVAGPDPAAAAGLTQIVASTGTGLLGMRIDLARDRRIAKALATAPDAARRVRLLALRRRVDPRFDPASALAATERYLAIAEARLHRADLAVESYHMGIGNLSGVLGLYGAGPVPYARLYFDSTPLRHAAAWSQMSRFGDDSATYYWRVLAARQLIGLYRSDPARLRALASRHGNAPSAEGVLRPPSTPAFADPAAVRAATARGALVAVPSGGASGLVTDGPVVLTPDALGVAEYLAAATRALSRTATARLELTAGTVDAATLGAGALRTGRTDSDALHATGDAFDVARRYPAPGESVAFQFLLDRLSTLGLIAWQRSGSLIHVVAAPGAARLRTLAG